MRWDRYVAVGDSFSEGLWDVPDDDGRLLGWTDRLAASLSARRVAAGQTPLEYANLAVRGRLLRPIVVDQVPAALAMEPGLVSLVGGGNDLLRLDADPDHLAQMLEAAVVRLRRRGVDVLLATGFDTREGTLIRHMRPKVAVLNAQIWSIARRHDAYVLDLWGMRSLLDWRMWTQDRIHLTSEGHARVAQAALLALGLPPDDPDWDDPLTPTTARRTEQALADARWLRDYAFPWATRLLHRRSSGERRQPKLPIPAPVRAPEG